MTGRKTAEQLVALTAFAAEVDGRQVLVHAGDAFPARSAVVKGRKALFVTESEHRLAVTKARGQ
jgi:hypothetical protein